MSLRERRRRLRGKRVGGSGTSGDFRSHPVYYIRLILYFCTLFTRIVLLLLYSIYLSYLSSFRHGFKISRLLFVIFYFS